tara:strand:- start:4435 stop:4698 length:264 start_codon:yes stop_codon:yes gene_type:complete
MIAPIKQEAMSGFFVWTKRGKAPRFHHDTIESAQAEAERLALIYPGQKFIVMAAVSKHSVPDGSGAGSESAAGSASADPAEQSREAA